ncbi:MAG: ribosome maturation factor RimM [Bacteroidota bacterium]
MIKKENFRKAGQILKAHGIAGELTAVFNADLFEKFEEMESLFIEIDGYLVPFFFEEIREKNDKILIIKFEDIDSDETANRYKGCKIYVEYIYMEQIIEEKSYVNCIGYQVFDETKKLIGIISEYVDIPGNPNFIVSSENKNFYIPANSDLIIFVDHSIKNLTMTIPEGLLDI